MKTRSILAALLTSASLMALAGCAVERGQSTVGQYLDDTTITTKVKGHFAENKAVDATAISVETLNGEVQLSGFAKSEQEKTTAENIAKNTEGVKSVKNSIVVKP